MSGMAEIACAQGHRVDDVVAEALTTVAIPKMTLAQTQN
jgi:hypothetical protein